MNNPWAGLASYQDPAGGSTLLFCGRDNESYDLAALVDDNIFCTLYGKSGTGKTSLLNAGVFPRLRAMGYLPVSIRLGMEAMDTTFQQCIASRLGQTATLETTDTVALPADDQDEQWLWAWFARTRFVDGEGKRRFAVLVFDQFEEVFRSRRGEAEALLRQIHFMMDPSHTLGESYDYNFRFLASIREDDLYLLEDSLDRNFMGDMKQCRYRLNALTDEGARDVILKPGKGLFAEGEQDEIVNTIIDIARSADGSINTNILSLVCSRIYEEYRRSGARSISLELVRGFVSGNPFEQFYNEVTRDLGEKEKRFIEDRLVDAAGRRGSVSEPDFEKNVPNGAHLLEGTGRILQRVASGTEGRSYRIELIHDSFCAPLSDQKMKRAARRRRRITIAVSVVALVIAAVAAWIVIMSVRNARQTREILIQQERFYAKQASRLLDEGDTYTALLLLNELTDPDGSFAKIPLQPEAEYQMRRAIGLYNRSEWQVMNTWQFEDIVGEVQVTPNGEYLLYSTIDAIKVVNPQTGRLVRTLEVPASNASIPNYVISHNSKLVAVQPIDLANACSDIFIFDIETGEMQTIHLLNHQNHDYGGESGGYSFNMESQMFFTPDDKMVAHIVDTVGLYLPWHWTGYKIRSFDYTTGEACYDFEIIDGTPIAIEAGNEKGKYVATINDKKKVIINEKSSGKMFYQFDIGDVVVWKYVNDDEIIAIKKDAVYKYCISSQKWERIIDKQFDMKYIGDAQVSETEILLSNVDTVFIYSLSKYQQKAFYRFDTLKNINIFLNKNNENNVFLVDKFNGKIVSMKYHQRERTEKEIVNENYYFMANVGDSLLLKMSQPQREDEWSRIEVCRVDNNKAIFCDSVNGTLTFDDISDDGHYALFTLINYKYDEKGEMIDLEEDPSAGLIFKLVDIKKWIITTILDTVEYWRYPFFIDNDNIGYFNKYDELTAYNISRNDTSLFMRDIYVFYPKSKGMNGAMLCENDDWYLFNPRRKTLKKIDGFKSSSACFTPDGKGVLSIMNNGVINIYDYPSMSLRWKRKGNVSRICSISPDGNYALLFNVNTWHFELWNLYPLYCIDDNSISGKYYQDGPVFFDKDGKNIIFYSGLVSKDGEIGFVKTPIMNKQEVVDRVRQLVGTRKLTEEEKSLLLE